MSPEPSPEEETEARKVTLNNGRPQILLNHFLPPHLAERLRSLLAQGGPVYFRLVACERPGIDPFNWAGHPVFGTSKAKVYSYRCPCVQDEEAEKAKSQSKKATPVARNF